MSILSEDYTKLVVFDSLVNKEVAVVTNDLITTASNEVVVKLTPKYN